MRDIAITYTLKDEHEERLKKIVEEYKKQQELKELEIKVNRDDVKLDNLLNTLNETYSMTYEKAKKRKGCLLKRQKKSI